MSELGDGRWPAGRYLLTGALATSLLVGGLGGWSVFAEISGAVIAEGTVEVEGNRQVVQHPTGGVIEAIFVRDGDNAEAGAVLIRLEGDKLHSELAVVKGQYLEILARKNRLAAQRDGLSEIAFDPELVATAEDVTVVALMAGEIQQFEAHRRALEDEVAALRERKIQIGRQIEGLAAQRDATARQADILREEVATQEALQRQGLNRRTDLLTPQRELARLEGIEGQLQAATAESQARIAEIEIEILRLGTERRKSAIAELRDLEFREIELRERRASLREDVNRLELRAPASGIVYGSTADTLRAVVRPAEPVMFIVPKETPLIVRARVEPAHINEVMVGQQALLRFSAFNARTTPEVYGEVVKVSADAIKDERTGRSYFSADIRVDTEGEEPLPELALLPGMPVEAFIRTGDRAPISYFVKPLSDYFARAFRET